jgi:uncharacterized repeat protein (TIGR01451 family)
MKRLACWRCVRLDPPWLRLLFCGALLALTHAATAATGFYATAAGTNAQSLWWLDLTGYNETQSGLGGVPYTFALPTSGGTLAANITKTSGLNAVSAVAVPPAAGVGAFGHGAYTGIGGLPVIYGTTNLGVPWAINVGSLAVKDAGNNARTYAIYAADAENTTTGESLNFGTTSTWSLAETVNYCTGCSGAPTVTGTGTNSVTETGANANSFNSSFIFGSANPTAVSAAAVGTQGVLFAIAMPPVTFTVTTLGRVNASDQFSATVGYTSPAYTLKTVSTSGTGTSAATGTQSIIGTNGITLAVSMAAGSVSALSAYAGSTVCTNAGPGGTTLPSGSGTSFTLTPKLGDSISCTLTLTPSQTLTGTVYNDANHDGLFGSGEAGAAFASLFVKIAPFSAGACQTPTAAAVTVNSSTGVYSIPGVFPGTYCLILSTSSTLNATATLPTGWIGTEGTAGIRQLTTTIAIAPVQNFGLYNGSSLSLVVFADTGTGTANDGVQNGSEPGVGSLRVTASVSGTAITNSTTAGNGAALLWFPASTSGTVTITPTAPAGYLATGGSAGTTGGAYARPNVTFAFAAGNVYTGITFGLVPANTLATGGQQTARAGTTVYYAHAFVAGSAGQVAFSTSAISKPAAAFIETLYLDVACTGSFVSSDTLITAAITVTPTQRVCLLVREFVPAGAALNTQNTITVGSSLVYSGTAAPATSVASVIDITTLSNVTALLTKQVQNLTTAGSYLTSNTALPGNTLQYQLTIVNQGNAALSTVVINDATPAYTTFASAACPGTLPASLTTCAVTAPTAGTAGALQWTFGGTLAPGTQTTVTYQVTIAQ